MHNPSNTSGEQVFDNLLAQYMRRTDHVMDLGCGEGGFTLSLAAKAQKVTGVDLSRKSIDLAKKRLGRSDIAHVSFVHASGQDLIFPGNSVDMMVSRYGPLGMSGFLDEARRVVKPGGILLEVTVGEEDGREVRKYLQTEDVDPAPGKQERLKERILNHGYRLEKFENIAVSQRLNSPEDVVKELAATRMISESRVREWSHILRQKWDLLSGEHGFYLTNHRVVWLAVNTK